MIYASSRSTVTKSLGSSYFVESLFVSSKSELTAEAYAEHKGQQSGPQPLTVQEKEWEAARETERVESGTSYQGSKGRRNHVGAGVGLTWSEEAQDAITALGGGEESTLVILVRIIMHQMDFSYSSTSQSIDIGAETIMLSSSAGATVDAVGSALPQAEPCTHLFSLLRIDDRFLTFLAAFAFFAWKRATARDIGARLRSLFSRVNRS